MTTNQDNSQKPSPMGFIFPMITFSFFGLLFFGVAGACMGGITGLYIGAIFETTVK